MEQYSAIHVPEFPVVAGSLEPAQRKRRPLIVLAGKPPEQIVYSCSRQAQRSGVAHGMSKPQAEATCAGEFRVRHIAQEQAAFEQLSCIAGRYSPHVEHIASPANEYNRVRRPAAFLLLDASGMGRFYPTAHDYAHGLHQELQQAGFPARVSVAPNAEAAMLLCEDAPGVVVGERATLARQLAPLPVAQLPCDERTRAVLARWGIRTLGQLAALPEDALVSRLGQQGHRLRLLARGEASRLLVPDEPAWTLQETVRLDDPIEVLDALLWTLTPMLDTLLHRARERAYALREVELLLTLDRAEAHTLHLRPAVPTQERETLLRLMTLELQARPPASGIVAIRLSAEPAAPARAQFGLFQPQFPEPGRLDLLLARLRAVVGEHNVGSPCLLNSHREDAFRVIPFAPAETGGPQTTPHHGLALRMLRSHPKARITTQGGEPKQLFWNGFSRSICSSAGPWHSSGSWWDEQTWDYDFWDVVVTNPMQRLRLQHNHRSGEWTVWGLYD